MNTPLVSIVMPVYNAGPYIREAIASVVAQSYTNWELLVVNDGSTDDSVDVIFEFKDPRIKVFHKSNGGIGSARNHALPHVKGEFLCGLDADDVLPKKSLEGRVAVFMEHPDTDIVDGRVVLMDKHLKKTLRIYEPKFIGDPFPELVAISGRCFMGFSWLIRWSPSNPVRFNDEVSHGEDLIFYFEYSPGKMYRHTQETVLLYRRTGHSSMADLYGLERSYKYMERWLGRYGAATPEQIAYFRRRRQRIMAASFWYTRKRWSALRAYFT